MNKPFKTIIIFIYLLSFWMSTPVMSQENEDALNLPRLNESQFYQQIERKTKSILRSVENGFTVEEKGRIEKATNAVLKFLKDQNPYHHVKELLMKHGLGVGITAGLTEFTTIVVLPAIFTSAGLPELAVLSAGTPSFLLTVPAFLGIKTMSIKRKIAKKLRISNIRALDKLRDDILGYAQKSRLLSVIVTRSRQELEVHVIKRPFSRFRNNPMGNVIDLNELKSLVAKHESMEVVNLIKDVTHGDDALFAHLLLKQIQRKSETFKEFKVLLDERVKDFPLSPHQQTQVILTHEKRQVISNRLEKVRELRKELLKKATTPNERTAVKEWANIQSIDLQNLDFDIQRFEYNLLSHIKAGSDISDLDLTAPQNTIVSRMVEIREQVIKVENWIKEDMERPLLMKKIRDINRLWIPLNTRLTPRGDCYGWMRSVLKTMGYFN